MKLYLVFLAAGMALAQTPVKSVYILPMPSGMDQFLALRLTQEQVLQVVTDPKKADVILTDRIGGDFEQTLKDLYGEPVPVTAEAPTFAKPNLRPLSARGAVFLVDRASGNVVWSTFEKAKNTNPDELNRAARRIVDRMADQLR